MSQLPRQFWTLLTMAFGVVVFYGVHHVGMAPAQADQLGYLALGLCFGLPVDMHGPPASTELNPATPPTASPTAPTKSPVS